MDFMKKQLTPVRLKCYSEFNCYCAWAFIKNTLDSCKNSQAVVRNTPLRTVMLEFCDAKLWNCDNTFWCQTLHYAPKKNIHKMFNFVKWFLLKQFVLHEAQYVHFGPIEFICNIWVWMKWETRIEYPSEIFRSGSNKRKSSEILDFTPSLAHKA